MTSVQWKMQLKPDVAAVQCRFKGTTAARLLTSSVAGVDDGLWHTATCWRAGGQLGVTVDGVDTTTTAWVGDIANTRPMLIGARSLSSAYRPVHRRDRLRRVRHGRRRR